MFFLICYTIYVVKKDECIGSGWVRRGFRYGWE